MLKCEVCGKEAEDYRAARGHVQFTNEPDGPHRAEGEIPDDYRALFIDMDDDLGDDDPDDADDEPATDEDVADAVDAVEDDEADDDQLGDDDSDGRSLTERLRLAATEDVRHLWGGE